LRKKKLNIECCAIELPKYDKHPNRLKFLGILGYVDTPSEKAPSGARGHKVELGRKAAVEALGSIVGMGVCRSADNTCHDAQRKIGVITSAKLIGKRIVVRGILYAKDFAKDVEEIRKGKSGMSYEIGDAHVHDLRKEVWMLTQINFTGAAVLLQEKAAYANTRFWIAKK
jgi:hypothetical protein